MVRRVLCCWCLAFPTVLVVRGLGSAPTPASGPAVRTMSGIRHAATADVVDPPPPAPEPPITPASASPAEPPDFFTEYDARSMAELRAQPQEGIDPARLVHHIPDPERARRDAAAGTETGKASERTFNRTLLERLDSIRRPNRVALRLAEATMRALANSFSIDVQRYNPAIESTRIVEAQAAFDAVFFTNITKQIQDRPSGSQLIASDFDLFQMESGVRQLLPTGMQVTGAYTLRRTSTTLSFQQLNPEYFSTFALSFRQPLLRGFGIDQNLATIRLARNTRHISDLQFRVDVRELLRNVEIAYWQLGLARRDLVVTARLLGEFEGVYQYLVARREFDVTKIQIEDTRANLETTKAELIAKRTAVRDAEDRLLALINDPQLNLTDQYEVFPVDVPTIGAFSLDRLGELQTALDKRPEIRQSKLRVANARIAVGQAVNGTLPRLDLSFTYTVDGIGGSADRAFDEVTKQNFNEYTVGVELEMPIGNRALRAAELRARLAESQAQAALRQQIETVILDVSVVLRRLETTYEQIRPRFETAEAAEREVESIVARAERKDFTQLNTELGARRTLANGRRLLLQSLLDYNTAIIDLERAKGTLLEYHNVIITDEPDPH